MKTPRKDGNVIYLDKSSLTFIFDSSPFICTVSSVLSKRSDGFLVVNFLRSSFSYIAMSC